jgi:hypothetical protein
MRDRVRFMGSETGVLEHALERALERARQMGVPG